MLWIFFTLFCLNVKHMAVVTNKQSQNGYRELVCWCASVSMSHTGSLYMNPFEDSGYLGLFWITAVYFKSRWQQQQKSINEEAPLNPVELFKLSHSTVFPSMFWGILPVSQVMWDLYAGKNVTVLRLDLRYTMSISAVIFMLQLSFTSATNSCQKSPKGQSKKHTKYSKSIPVRLAC